ncbi:aldo/keto reductase [Chitinophaga flava]|uniref:NADP-dependent oxidoreductase domain-containing protein n=1 Tax=Chitinophaga flava TaxID=2259036 RepID=A0A365XUM6_9BACT|nr:aldo/keto reductase [Chitinophaga flava]RBL89295.1 hypothetical protein DF182_22500 [Chitinophaga flava]
MIQLNELSRVGLGMYRMSLRVPEHAATLQYALDNGCNLLDTASNYENGDSEKLIGKVLQQSDHDNTFIVTKAGYISNDNLVALKELHKSGRGLDDLVVLNEHFCHSVHPEYLAFQMDISMQRLGRNVIDGFLLHSPEYFFEQQQVEPTADEYYRRIKKAFEFLETQVAAGRIRYYGVSSNTMSVTDSFKSTNLYQLIKIAEEVSSTHHFRLAQFPYNIIEQQAGDTAGDTQKSLLEVAAAHSIKTFGNRPLNANSPTGVLRLVTHQMAITAEEEEADITVHAECFRLLEYKLQEKKPGSTMKDFTMLSFLKDNWRAIPHEEAYNKLIHGTFFPMAQLLFDNHIPSAEMELFRTFQQLTWKYCRKTSSARVITYLKENNLEQLLAAAATAALPAALCREYINQGIDHVLVGMRKPAYVDQMKALIPGR